MVAEVKEEGNKIIDRMTYFYAVMPNCQYLFFYLTISDRQVLVSPQPLISSLFYQNYLIIR